MSAHATGFVWRHSPLTGAQLLVHLAIADVVNDVHGNEVWLSTSAIAEKARVARSTVIETLRVLVELGLLEVLEPGGRSRRPTRYRFVDTPPADPASPVSGLAPVDVADPASPVSGLAPVDVIDAASPVTGLAPVAIADAASALGGLGMTGERSSLDRPAVMTRPPSGHNTEKNSREPKRTQLGVAAFGDAAKSEPDHPDALLAVDELGDEVEVVDTPDVTELAVAADAPATKEPRRRDELWEALLTACGISGPIPASARGAYNRAVADLRDLGVTPADIHVRARVFRLRWPSASLTPTALARRWAECAPNPAHLPGRQLTRAEAALVRLAEGLA